MHGSIMHATTIFPGKITASATRVWVCTQRDCGVCARLLESSGSTRRSQS